MNRLGFVFQSAPHSTSKGREGLDAILAASAYSEDIQIFFIGDGVLQLLKNQEPKRFYLGIIFQDLKCLNFMILKRYLFVRMQ